MSRAAIVAREAVEFVYETAARERGLADAALSGVTARAGAIGRAVSAILGRRIAGPVTAGGSADPVLTGVTARTPAIGRAVGAILAGSRIAGPVVVANGWWVAHATV